MRKEFLHLFVLSLLILPLSAGAMYDPEAEVSDTDGMQNRARVQMNADEAEPMLLEANLEDDLGAQNRWQERVQKLKEYKSAKQTKKMEQKQYREEVQNEWHNFRGEMTDFVQEKYQNWQNTLDKKFDKWEARVEKAKDSENAEMVESILTDIERLKVQLSANLVSLEASRTAIANLQSAEDKDLWVAEHQGDWQIHKSNLLEFKDNMKALNEYLKTLKGLLQ